jgi:hypothetical protein
VRCGPLLREDDDRYDVEPTRQLTGRPRPRSRRSDEWTDQQVAVTTEQGFPLWHARGTIFRGWVKVKNGNVADGISLLRRGSAAYRATGAEVWMPHHIALLARAYEIAGQVEEGLTLLDEALQIVERTRERWLAAELNRALGEHDRGQCRLTNRSLLARRIDPGLAFMSGRAKPERERRRDVPPNPALLLRSLGGVAPRLRQVLRIVLRGSSPKYEQNQSCCGLAPLRGCGREHRGPRTRPLFDMGKSAAASRLLNQSDRAPGHGGNWWTAKFC